MSHWQDYNNYLSFHQIYWKARPSNISVFKILTYVQHLLRLFRQNSWNPNGIIIIIKSSKKYEFPRLSLSLSLYPSQSSITFGKSSWRHPMLIFLQVSQNWYIHVSIREHPPYFTNYPAYLVHLTLVAYKMGGKWPYCCYFVGCYFQHILKTRRSILALFSWCFFSNHFNRAQLVQPYHSTDTATA